MICFPEDHDRETSAWVWGSTQLFLSSVIHKRTKDSRNLQVHRDSIQFFQFYPIINSFVCISGIIYSALQRSIFLLLFSTEESRKWGVNYPFKQLNILLHGDLSSFILYLDNLSYLPVWSFIIRILPVKIIERNVQTLHENTKRWTLI